MTAAIQVAGLATIKVGTGVGGALETLGTTRNGAEITFEGFFLDVPNDDQGGDEGPPTDVQFLGSLARIRCELTKWDSAVAAEIIARIKDTAAGIVGLPGRLMLSGTQAWIRVVVATDADRDGTNEGGYDFVLALPRQPIELNAGTKFSTLLVEFEAHRRVADNVLYAAYTEA